MVACYSRAHNIAYHKEQIIAIKGLISCKPIVKIANFMNKNTWLKTN